MMVSVMMSDVKNELTEEERKEIEEASRLPIEYDEDSPRMTPEMLKQFHGFDAIPIRVSQDKVRRAKELNKDYISFLSRLLDKAFDDPELVKRCI